jgi:predicted transcriptional regulator
MISSTSSDWRCFFESKMCRRIKETSEHLRVASMDDGLHIDATVNLVAKIVTRYVAHQHVAADELANLIRSVGEACRGLGKPTTSAEVRTPAVAVRSSVQREFVVCLDCGFRGRVIRRHIRTRHGLTPDEYRARWNLPSGHPLVALAYSEQRSAAAKQIGLGRRQRTPVTPAAEAGLDPASVASLSVRGRRRRSVASSKA